MPCGYKKKRKENNSLMSDERGFIAYAVIFFVLLVFLIFMFAFIIPVSLNINTKMYVSGEDQLNDALDSISQIQDENVQADLNATVLAARDGSIEGVGVLAFFIQYSWIFIVVVIVFVVVMLAQQNVQRVV